MIEIYNYTTFKCALLKWQLNWYLISNTNTTNEMQNNWFFIFVNRILKVLVRLESQHGIVCVLPLRTVPRHILPKNIKNLKTFLKLSTFFNVLERKFGLVYLHEIRERLAVGLILRPRGRHIPHRFSQKLTIIIAKKKNMIGEQYMPWWRSGYRVCFTRRRSPVQTRPVVHISTFLWNILKIWEKYLPPSSNSDALRTGRSRKSNNLQHTKSFQNLKNVQICFLKMKYFVENSCLRAWK